MRHNKPSLVLLERTEKRCEHCSGYFTKESGHWLIVRDGEWRCKAKRADKEKKSYSKKSLEERLRWNQKRYARVADRPSPVKTKFNNLKATARLRGLPFELTIDEYSQLIKSNSCTYCGGELPLKGSGIDRINPDLGYLLENSTACCLVCNIAKGTMTSKMFLAWAERVVHYSKSQEKSGG